MQKIYPPWPTPDFVPDFSNITFDDDFSKLSKMVSPNVTESVLECKIGGQPCSPANFTTTATDMGYCFSFNTANQSFVVNAEGAANGLYLLLFANQDDYLVTSSPSAGFRILLHRPDEAPSMKDWAFKVAVGQDTLISMSVKNITELGKPYGDCNDTKGYKETGCRQQCYANYITEQCNCRDIYMPGNHNLCNPKQYYECLLPKQAEYTRNNHVKKCACDRECSKIAYNIQLSSAAVSNYFTNFMQQQFGVPTTFLRENFLQVNIFYSELSYEEVQSFPGYPVGSLLSDIGGAFGLIIGSTVLTVVELFDFTIKTVVDFVAFKVGEKRKPKP